MLLLVLAGVFVVGPLVELYVIIQVAHVIGAWQAIALLVAESLFGAWLMKRQGRAVLLRIQSQLQDYQLPTKELVDGALILLAGALMIAPGFITDFIGFLLLLPPTRAIARVLVMRHFKGRLGRGYSFLGGGHRCRVQRLRVRWPGRCVRHHRPRAGRPPTAARGPAAVTFQ